jgi:hypothetical protein
MNVVTLQLPVELPKGRTPPLIARKDEVPAGVHETMLKMAGLGLYSGVSGVIQTTSD